MLPHYYYDASIVCQGLINLNCTCLDQHHTNFISQLLYFFPLILSHFLPASLTSFLVVIMSDEEAQTIVDQALKTGSIEQRNILAVVVGIAGSGKTSLISRLFREKPPDRYTSTGVVEQSLRGLMQHIANRKSWERLSIEEIFKIFASFIQAGLPEADIASLAKNFTEEEEPEDSSEKELSPPQPGTPSPSPSQKSYASETMIGFVQMVQGSKKAALIEFVHMIDTGGQPEFMEIMPSLIHNSNLTLLVLNLDQSLDEVVQFVFCENDTLFKRPLPSIRTNRQVIHQLARTLQAKWPTHKGSQYFKVSVIGTHRDCVEKKGKLPETLEAMNEEVQSIFTEDELMNEIVPVNLKEPDDKDEKVLEELRQCISNADIGVKAKIPFSFFMFEHEAIKYAEQKKDRKVMILSFEECVEVGARLKMSHEVVKAALIFFHRHNIFLYFQHILPNVVFLAPQVPLDFVNAIIALAYKVRSVPFSILAPKYKRFCKEGIITGEMLCDESLQLSDHFIPGIYKPQDAINLFLHIYAIAPLSNEEPLAKNQQPHTSSSMPGQKSLEEREYLMMSLLEDKPKEDIQKCLRSLSEVAPLVIHFSGGCVPNGCFGNTISCLISTYNWEVCRTKKVAKCLAHNIVTLSDPKLPVTITIVNYTQHLEIHVDTYNVEKEDLSDFCSCIRKTIFEAIKQKVFKLMRFEEIVVKPAFLCPCDCDPAHVAEICSDSDIVCKNSYIVCSKTAHRSQGRLQEQHLLWFQDRVQNLEQKPIMLSEAYEGLVGISHKWQDVGLQLKLEEGILKGIESDHPKNSRDCLREMLSKWLKIDPRPTWHTLCAALHSETVGEEKLAGSLGAKYVKCKHFLVPTHTYSSVQC